MPVDEGTDDVGDDNDEKKKKNSEKEPEIDLASVDMNVVSANIPAVTLNSLRTAGVGNN